MLGPQVFSESLQVISKKGDGSIFLKNRTVPFSSFSWFLEFRR